MCEKQFPETCQATTKL